MVDTECRADRRSILLRVETAEDERLAWLDAHASEQKLGIEGHQDAFHEIEFAHAAHVAGVLPGPEVVVS